MDDGTFVQVSNMLEANLRQLQQNGIEDHAGLTQQGQEEHQNLVHEE
jgi:hypothetical protein